MKKNKGKNKKIHVTDTIKNITKNPQRAMKADYEQTKADMENIKDETVEKFEHKKNDWDRE